MKKALVSWGILAAVSLALALWMEAIGNTLTALCFLVLFARCVAELLWVWDWR